MSRLAVVTGGSRGIGLAVAERFASAGLEVVITGRDEARLAEVRRELGPLVRTLALDATDHDATARELGALDVDILVANVGVGYSASITDTTLDDWNRLMDTNVAGAFVALRSVLPGMLERRWGRIVTIGSFASHQPIRFGIGYTASKHALLGLTRAAALDTRGRGVTVNMVAPAFVRTDMMIENAKTIAAASSRSVAEVEQRLADVSSLGRLIEPEEVADEVMAFVDAADISGEIRVMGDAPDR
jgi:NAD(P)-dependent dehydrogenase (short-subunit alcohol dehydrogenase family)